MIDFLREGGWTAWLILFLSLPTIVLAILHAVFAEKWTLAIGASLIGLTLAAGILGTLHGRAITDEAVMAVDPEMAEQLRAAGYQEASHPALLGVPIALVAAVPLVVGEVKRRRRG